MKGRAEHIGRIRNAHIILVGKHERRPLGRPAGLHEDNVTLYHKQIGCEGVDWIKLAQVSVQWLSVSGSEFVD